MGLNERKTKPCIYQITISLQKNNTFTADFLELNLSEYENQLRTSTTPLGLFPRLQDDVSPKTDTSLPPRGMYWLTLSYGYTRRFESPICVTMALRGAWEEHERSMNKRNRRCAVCYTRRFISQWPLRHKSVTQIGVPEISNTIGVMK